MSNHFFNLLPDEQAALIKKAGDQLDMPDMIIEKDLWVCWLLEKLFSLPIQMAFKGGTSLSKVFNLIKRFSEDCDVTIDYRNFQEEIDLERTSRTQIKKASDRLKEQLKNYIFQTVLPYMKEQVSTAFPDKLFEFTLSDNGEELRFYYPSVCINYLVTDDNMRRVTDDGNYRVVEANRYLRDHVLIEFGIRNSTEPCEKHQIIPYLSQVINQDIELPKPMINTLSPLRTFWEKATLIHVECHRERMTKSPERLSRHWYDLCMLQNSWVGEQALLSSEILKSVIDHKKAFFNASYASYDDCLSGNFCLIPVNPYFENLEKDFTQMREAGMFHESPPAFNKIMESMEDLKKAINQKNWK